MSLQAFEFMRRYIHFIHNNNAVSSDDPAHDPLWKMRNPLKMMMKGISKCWSTGKDVTIDEGMILYKGRAVPYVQFMPSKPKVNKARRESVYDLLRFVVDIARL